MVKMKTAITCVLIVAGAIPAWGQTKNTGAGHARIGLGLFQATDDDAQRVKNPQIVPTPPASSARWLTRATFFMYRRVGIGVEAVWLGTAQAVLDAACCYRRDLDTEKAIVATGHCRVFALGPTGVEIVGGVGSVLQHRETLSYLRVISNAEKFLKVENLESNVGMFGIDVPVRLKRFFSISPLMRIYSLRRDSRNVSLDVFGPSHRILAGIVADVVW